MPSYSESQTITMLRPQPAPSSQGTMGISFLVNSDDRPPAGLANSPKPAPYADCDGVGRRVGVQSPTARRTRVAAEEARPRTLPQTPTEQYNSFVTSPGATSSGQSSPALTQAGIKTTLITKKSVCSHCQEGFQCDSLKRKHEARHTKPHKCPVDNCQRSKLGFTSKNDLTRHLNSVHKHCAVGYNCQYDACTEKRKIYYRLDNFRNHLKKMHFKGDLNKNKKQLEDDRDEFLKRAEYACRYVQDEPSDAASDAGTVSAAGGQHDGDFAAMASGMDAEMSAVPEEREPTPERDAYVFEQRDSPSEDHLEHLSEHTDTDAMDVDSEVDAPSPDEQKEPAPAMGPGDIFSKLDDLKEKRDEIEEEMRSLWRMLEIKKTEIDPEVKQGLMDEQSRLQSPLPGDELEQPQPGEDDKPVESQPGEGEKQIDRFLSQRMTEEPVKFIHASAENNMALGRNGENKIGSLAMMQAQPAGKPEDTPRTATDRGMDIEATSASEPAGSLMPLPGGAIMQKSTGAVFPSGNSGSRNVRPAPASRVHRTGFSTLPGSAPGSHGVPLTMSAVSGPVAPPRPGLYTAVNHVAGTGQGVFSIAGASSSRPSGPQRNSPKGSSTPYSKGAYKCDEPGCKSDSFRRPCDLKKHKKRHRPLYSCTYACDKRLATKFDWMRHENECHHKWTQYKCQIPKDASNPEGGFCNYRTFRCDAMRDHLKSNVHGMPDQTPEGKALIHRLADKFMLGGTGNHVNFWCGFCKNEKSNRRGKTIWIDSWSQRYDHIEHHYKVLRETIDQWVDEEEAWHPTSEWQSAPSDASENEDDEDSAVPHRKRPKNTDAAATEHASKRNKVVSTATQPESREPEELTAAQLPVEGPSSLAQATGTDTVWYCCQRCENRGPWMPGMYQSCMGCGHKKCLSCTETDAPQSLG